MRVSYQHTNVYDGNESTLLRFTDEDGTRACVLVDAGAGVDLDSHLEADEYLNAILLTHGHIDHYRTLARNVRHNAPIYTSPATATILEHALPEAQKDNELGDVSVALDALEPIDDWASILDTLEVRPVSAGHTPGATGFVIRFRDEAAGDELFDAEQHVLVTGDFTTRPCAGFSGLATSYPFDIDAVFLNVSTDDSYMASLNESLRTVLERAYAGSRVVVATSSLAGVHYATVLERLSTALDRELPITLAGQAAKLANALELDVPGVETREVFDGTADVLEEGRITIAGPDSPTKGSTSRLLNAIEDDSAGVFVQLATGNADAVSNVSCTTQYVEFRNHPPPETVDEFVRDLAPRQVVIKHARGETLNRFQRRFDHCFTWGTNDEDIHRLYEGGEWTPPDWLAETTATQIRTRQWEAMQNRSFDPDTRLSPLRRGSVDLEAEGVELETLEDVFARTATDPYVTSDRDTDDETDAVDTETGDPRRNDGNDSVERDLLERLEAIEAKLERSEETVHARVLADGNGERILRLLEPADVDVDAGDIVEITITESGTERE
ncbi:MBL fold metallo-hydrolase [Halomontanus rarus]|uniref:MBL fold metallo-hydrolase n=1 Tax=Halomontanus rarus TaxID=3034020 RepID=UPI001A986304